MTVPPTARRLRGARRWGSHFCCHGTVTGLSFCWHPLSVHIETPTKGRGGFSRMLALHIEAPAKRRAGGHRCAATGRGKPSRMVLMRPQHGLSSNTMARITSGCGANAAPAASNGPDRLGLYAGAAVRVKLNLQVPSQHGLSSKTMALITSD